MNKQQKYKEALMYIARCDQSRSKTGIKVGKWGSIAKEALSINRTVRECIEAGENFVLDGKRYITETGIIHDRELQCHVPIRWILENQNKETECH